MAIQISPNKEYGKLIDLFNGKNDLINRTIRVIHNNSYEDDPTRIFRAIRFSTRFQFPICFYFFNFLIYLFIYFIYLIF